jgi:hypothetical protein
MPLVTFNVRVVMSLPCVVRLLEGNSAIKRELGSIDSSVDPTIVRPAAA